MKYDNYAVRSQRIVNRPSIDWKLEFNCQNFFYLFNRLEIDKKKI